MVDLPTNKSNCHSLPGSLLGYSQYSEKGRRASLARWPVKEGSRHRTEWQIMPTTGHDSSEGMTGNAGWCGAQVARVLHNLARRLRIASSSLTHSPLLRHSHSSLLFLLYGYLKRILLSTLSKKIEFLIPHYLRMIYQQLKEWCKCNHDYVRNRCA